jgi:hypothetical protein
MNSALNEKSFNFVWQIVETVQNVNENGLGSSGQIKIAEKWYGLPLDRLVKRRVKISWYCTLGDLGVSLASEAGLASVLPRDLDLVARGILFVLCNITGGAYSFPDSVHNTLAL